MADNDLRAPKPSLELREDIDETKLTPEEKEMLDRLKQSQQIPEPAPIPLAPPPETPAREEPVQVETPKETVLELPEEPPAMPEPPKLEDLPEDAPAPIGDAGEKPELLNCPHCSWDLSMPSLVEPEHQEKLSFLHSVLGQKPFVKQYEMFGGQVVVRFRTLTTKEMDVIYRAVFKQREQGLILTAQDYWEKVNRYRLYLQLVYLSAVDGSFTHKLPDSYSKETNSHGTEFWEFSSYDPEVGYLDNIEDKILTEVLRTETIQRSIANYCARFNRLVSKLEVMVDNSDFWKETEQQS